MEDELAFKVGRKRVDDVTGNGVALRILAVARFHNVANEGFDFDHLVA